MAAGGGGGGGVALDLPASGLIHKCEADGEMSHFLNGLPRDWDIICAVAVLDPGSRDHWPLFAVSGISVATIVASDAVRDVFGGDPPWDTVELEAKARCALVRHALEQGWRALAVTHETVGARQLFFVLLDPEAEEMRAALGKLWQMTDTPETARSGWARFLRSNGHDAVIQAFRESLKTDLLNFLVETVENMGVGFEDIYSELNSPTLQFLGQSPEHTPLPDLVRNAGLALFGRLGGVRHVLSISGHATEGGGALGLADDLVTLGELMPCGPDTGTQWRVVVETCFAVDVARSAGRFTGDLGADFKVPSGHAVRALVFPLSSTAMPVGGFPAAIMRQDLGAIDEDMRSTLHLFHAREGSTRAEVPVGKLLAAVNSAVEGFGFEGIDGERWAALVSPSGGEHFRAARIFSGTPCAGADLRTELEYKDNLRLFVVDNDTMGDTLLFRLGSHAIAIDGGHCTRAQRRSGRNHYALLAPIADSLGSLDIIVTHADQDHIKGSRKLLDDFKASSDAGDPSKILAGKLTRVIINTPWATCDPSPGLVRAVMSEASSVHKDAVALRADSLRAAFAVGDDPPRPSDDGNIAAEIVGRNMSSEELLFDGDQGQLRLRVLGPSDPAFSKQCRVSREGHGLFAKGDVPNELSISGVVEHVRDGAIVATVFFGGDGHLTDHSPLTESLRGYDQRLDVVQLLHHGSLYCLSAGGAAAIAERIKDEGVIFFSGLRKSSYPPHWETVTTLVASLFEQGREDVVIQAAYPFERMAYIAENLSRDASFWESRKEEGALHPREGRPRIPTDVVITSDAGAGTVTFARPTGEVVATLKAPKDVGEGEGGKSAGLIITPSDHSVRVFREGDFA